MQDFYIGSRKILEMSELSDGGYRTYCKLVDFAFNQVFCFPKISTLAERLDISSSTVKNHLRELRELGLVKVYRKHCRANNTYVILPDEWVEGKKVNDREQFIETEEEFKQLKDEIKEYYESIGRKVEVKKKKKSKRKSMKDRVKDVKEKLENEVYDFDAMELIALFYKEYYDNYGLIYDIKWGLDNACMKQAFINQAVITMEEVVQIIKVYIEMYDDRFKKAGQPLPTITQLKQGWVVREVAQIIVDREDENINRGEDIDISDVEHNGVF